MDDHDLVLRPIVSHRITHFVLKPPDTSLVSAVSAIDVDLLLNKSVINPGDTLVINGLLVGGLEHFFPYVGKKNPN